MATGTTVLDFGSFPGKSDASIDVSGQSGIIAGSLVEAWIRPETTSDHSADEHMIETLRIFAGNIVAGVGFTIYGFNSSQLNEPVSPPSTGKISADIGPGKQDSQSALTFGGYGTRIYGQWTVAWAWV